LSVVGTPPGTLSFVDTVHSLHSPPPFMPTSTFMPQNEPLCIKLLVLGTASVGKSSLLLRFTDQQWLPEGERIPTIGVDTLVKLLTCVNGRSGSLTLASFQVHKLDVKGKRVVLNIWVRESFHTVMRLRHDIMMSFIGHRWRRAPPCPHIVVLSRSTRHHPRCVTKKRLSRRRNEFAEIRVLLEK
jgi:hypothetical protein